MRGGEGDWEGDRKEKKKGEGRRRSRWPTPKVAVEVVASDEGVVDRDGGE